MIIYCKHALSACFSHRPAHVLDVSCINLICDSFIVLNDLLNSESVELLCLFVQFGSACCVAYLYSLVLYIVLLICTVWFCMLFCLCVQFFGSAHCFDYLYSLVLCIVLLICKVWFCMLFCLSVQFGSAGCVAYLCNLVQRFQFGFLTCEVWL